MFPLQSQEFCNLFKHFILGNTTGLQLQYSHLASAKTHYMTTHWQNVNVTFRKTEKDGQENILVLSDAAGMLCPKEKHFHQQQNTIVYMMK